jgi:hypothetical protein
VFALSWSTKRTLPSAAIQIGFPDPSSANTTPSMRAPYASRPHGQLDACLTTDKLGVVPCVH